MKATRWRKSSRSTSQNACVELDVSLAETRIRDSKNPAGRTLAIGVHTWTAFLNEIIRNDCSK